MEDQNQNKKEEEVMTSKKSAPKKVKKSSKSSAAGKKSKEVSSENVAASSDGKARGRKKKPKKKSPSSPTNSDAKDHGYVGQAGCTVEEQDEWIKAKEKQAKAKATSTVKKDGAGKSVPSNASNLDHVGEVGCTVEEQDEWIKAKAKKDSTVKSVPSKDGNSAGVSEVGCTVEEQDEWVKAKAKKDSTVKSVPSIAGNSANASEVGCTAEEKDEWVKAKTKKASTMKSVSLAKARKQGSGSNDSDTDVEPVPKTALRRNEEGSQPGAVPVPGIGAAAGGNEERDSFDEQQDNLEQADAQQSTVNPEMTDQQGDVHLINAVLVNDEEDAKTSDVPVAEATKLELPKDRKRLYCLLGFGAGIIIVVVIVVVVVVVTGNSGNGGDAEPENFEDLTVVTQLDDSPEETGWSLVCGSRVVNSIPPSTYAGLNRRLLTINTEVGLQEDCEFTIIDSAGNGITDGFFQIFQGFNMKDPNLLLAEGSGNFTDSASVPIFVETPLDTSSPTSTPYPTMSPAPTGSHGTSTLVVEIQLDQFPAETGWSLICNGDTLADFSPRSFATRAQLISQEFVLDVGVECTFLITDEFGDGICCSAGSGFFRLTKGVNGTAIAEGGEYSFEQKENFTMTAA